MAKYQMAAFKAISANLHISPTRDTAATVDHLLQWDRRVKPIARTRSETRHCCPRGGCTAPIQDADLATLMPLKTQGPDDGLYALTSAVGGGAPLDTSPDLADCRR
jgi:hypothetical protein